MFASPRLSPPVRSLLVLPIVLAMTLGYLGMKPASAVLAAILWVCSGAVGASLIERLFGKSDSSRSFLLVLGPGGIVGSAMVTGVFLGVRGGPIGVVLVIGLMGVCAIAWSRTSRERGDDENTHSATPLVVALIGLALLANAKEFPNLLLPSIAVLLLGLLWNRSQSKYALSIATATTVLVLVREVSDRADYWWWSSDDTTTLSAIGTIIVERGRVADIAGWSTSSHHWFLHAWLALWNNLSAGYIFETYQVAWPLVASVSMLASLWLILEWFLGHAISARVFALVAIVVAGLVRLDWSAPQEQEPFLFAMVACCLLWLRPSRSLQSQPFERRNLSSLKVCGVGAVLVAVPLWLAVMKPSLLVAFGLLAVGTWLVRRGFTAGRRLTIAVVISIGAILLGLTAMSIGSRWVAERSFTSFEIKFFPEDLGWCQSGARVSSVACVFSLQFILFTAVFLAIPLTWIVRRLSPDRVSSVLLLPLALAYLPLRYFVSSGVGSGAPSFYQLSEMAMMLFVAVTLASLLVQNRPKYLISITLFAAAFSTTLLIMWISNGPNSLYDWVDAILTTFRPTRFLNALDVIAMFVLLVISTVFARIKLIRKWSTSRLILMFCLVGVTPITRLTLESWRAPTSVERIVRPDYLGPPDIEDATMWMRTNTPFGTLYATNFLCPESRLSECTNSQPAVECSAREPWMMSSWALAALSRREFLYLSQGWDEKTNYYFLHKASTRLSGELSPNAIVELRGMGVDYYVASRRHTDAQVWSQLQNLAEFSTEHFSIVSMSRLAGG